MIEEQTSFVGESLIEYLGIFTLILLILTATIGILHKYNIKFIPLKWHPWIGIFTILVAIIHAILVLTLL